MAKPWEQYKRAWERHKEACDGERVDMCKAIVKDIRRMRNQTTFQLGDLTFFLSTGGLRFEFPGEAMRHGGAIAVEDIPGLVQKLQQLFPLDESTERTE